MADAHSSPAEVLARRFPQPEPMVTDESVAWARIGDVVLGYARSTVENCPKTIEHAYNLLDDSQQLRRFELWNVLLIVQLADEGVSARRCARRVERDLRRSRKLALLPGEEIPDLFGALGRGIESGVVPGSRDPVSAALDEVSRNDAERSALDALLARRRSASQIATLIDQLGERDVAEE